MKSLKSYILLVGLCCFCFFGFTANAVAQPTCGPDDLFIREGDTVYACSCSQEDVQAAIDDPATVDGDTVVLPAGSCTWTSYLDVTKGITIHGAGIDNTTIIDSTSNDWHEVPFWIDVDQPKQWRLTELTITGTGTTTDANGVLVINGDSSFRIDHVKFVDLNSRALMIRGNAYGVIDHCQFINLTSQGISVRPETPSNIRDIRWSTSTEMGGIDAVYIEDCTFSNDSDSYVHAAIDSEFGAKWVFRYNACINSWVVCHGHEMARGTLRTEIYKNTFESSSNTYPSISIRGGTSVIFDNTITGSFWKAIILKDYSICETQWEDNPCIPENACDSYPCTDQVGRTYDQQLAPVYQWDNTWDGDPIISYIHFLHKSCTDPSVYDVIQKDRDYYDEDASFDGTSGVGVGTTASRPATCTEGVAYWNRNEETLYQCSPTDTWTAYYIPYTYPHPLTQDSIRGDLNADSQINIQDIQACVNHILGTQSYAAADVNGSGGVDVVDVQEIVNIILGG